MLVIVNAKQALEKTPGDTVYISDVLFANPSSLTLLKHLTPYIH